MLPYLLGRRRPLRFRIERARCENSKRKSKNCAAESAVRKRHGEPLRGERLDAEVLHIENRSGHPNRSFRAADRDRKRRSVTSPPFRLHWRQKTTHLRAASEGKIAQAFPRPGAPRDRSIWVRNAARRCAALLKTFTG